MFLANPLNESPWAFPVLESVHLLGIFVGLGTAALVNLSLLGVASGPAKLWREMLLPTMIGLMVAIFSGLLLFSIDPELYLSNEIFRYKIGVLVVALAFYYTAVRRAAGRDKKASVVAILSLVLFALVPLGGVYLGYK
ncbi:MAG: hypothetical protein ABIR70_03090 [Bryobacteraceae bacterium]